jgi:serine/threonine protein kinase
LADQVFKLPALNAEQENLVKLAIEHYDRTGSKPSSTELMLRLEMDVDEFQALLDSVPSIYLHKPIGNASDETMFAAMAGLRLVPGNDELIEAFLRLFRVGAAVYLRRPKEALFKNDRIRTLLPKVSDKEFLKFSYALMGGYYPGLMQKAGRPDGNWSVAAGLPVLEFRAVRSLEDYYKIIDARTSKPADLNAELDLLRAAVCEYWRKNGDWPDLIAFAGRYRNRANVVRLLEELPERYWHRVNIDSITDHLVGSIIRLRLEGVLTAGNCPKEMNTLVQMIPGFIAHFNDTQGKTPISHRDLAKNINLDEELVRRVGLLIQHEAYTGIFIEDAPNWNAHVRKDVTRYKGVKDVPDFIARKKEQARREDQRSYPPRKTSVRAAKRTIGQYSLIEELGQGANGVVWKAEDPSGSVQAIKLLKELDQEEAKRLARELKLAATLRHEGLVTYLSTDLELVDGQHFIRMEFVDGSSIKQLVGWKGQTCRPQSVDQFVHWLRGVLPPLACMHAARVVHRDLHAGNVMVARSGAIKIVDYGSARLIKETDGTRTFSIPGTSTHTAEEVWEEPSSATPSSDYFSLGVIGYLLLTGQVPFWDQSVPKLYRRIQACEFPSPRQLRADIPAWADGLIRTLILKDPNKRWQDAEAIGKLLELVGTDPAAADQLVEQEWESRKPRPAAPTNVLGGIQSGGNSEPRQMYWDSFQTIVARERDLCLKKVSAPPTRPGVRSFQFQYAPVEFTKRFEDLRVLTNAMRMTSRQTTGMPMGTVELGNWGKAIPQQDGVRMHYDLSQTGDPLFMQSFEWWFLHEDGGFFLMRNANEGASDANALLCDTFFWRMAEMIDHCVALYEALGFPLTTELKLMCGIYGIRDMHIAPSDQLKSRGFWPMSYKSNSDETTTEWSGTIAKLKTENVRTTTRLTNKLLQQFEFFAFDEGFSEQLHQEYRRTRGK